MTQLSAWDFVAMLLYLAATMALGWWIAGRTKTGTDFFLGGRQLPWWAIGFSLVATDIAGTDITSLGGETFAHGFVLANFMWIGSIPAMLVAAFVFVPRFWRSGVATIPEYMERRFNVSVRLAMSLSWLIFMACNVGIILYASSLMLRTLWGFSTPVDIGSSADLGFMLSCIALLAASVGVYTLRGGMAAVVYTDVLQYGVILLGCALVVILGVGKLGGVASTIDGVEKNAEVRWTESYLVTSKDTNRDPLGLILPVDTPTPYPWTAVFFGIALVLGPAYWLGNQAIVQRALSARSEYEAKASYVWGALLRSAVPFVIAVPGLIALATAPQIAGGARLAIPTLVSELLPVGVRGIFLAAFLAALMSSLDSYAHSTATLVTYDFYKRFLRPEAGEADMLRVGRIITAGVLIWGAVFAAVLLGMRSPLFTVFPTLLAFFQGPALAVILAAFFWPRANSMGALVGFVSGVAISVGLFLLNMPRICGMFEIQPLFQEGTAFLYFAIWSFLVSLGMIVLVSLYGQPEPAERIRPLVYDPAQLVTLLRGKAPPGARALLGFLTLCGALFILWTQLPHDPEGTPLHDYANYLRGWLIRVPMHAARGLFLSLLLFVLFWVLTLPRREVVAPPGEKSLAENLKIWGALALMLQIVIYYVA